MRHLKGLCTVAVLIFGLFAVGGAGMPVLAQTGPGGVGTTDGTSDLRIWMRADDGVSPTTDGSTVTGWTNQAGTSDPTAAGNPTFQNGSSDLVGGEPVVRFDGTDDQFDFGSAFGVPGGDNTLIVVSKKSGSQADQALIGFGAGGTPRRSLEYQLTVGRGGGLEFPIGAVSGDPEGNGQPGPEPGEKAVAGSFNTGNFAVFSSIRGGGSQDLLANGEFLDQNDAVNASGNGVVGQNVIGDVAEVIAFRGRLDAAELTIVHNYLATKYGLSLGPTIADVYGWDSGYPGDVAGVGRANGIQQAPQGSKSVAQSSGLYLDTGSQLSGTGEFALYGHDEANLAFTDVEPPNGRSSNIQKLAREWRVDMTKKTSVNGVTMGFDQSVLPESERLSDSGNPYNDYYLYVDGEDSDFTSGATAYDLEDQGGGLYTTPTDVTIEDGDYVAIARIQRTVTYQKSEGGNFENANGNNSDNPVSVTATLNFEDSKSISVPYTVSNITKTIDGQSTNAPVAGSNDDYTVGSGSFSFPAGSTSDTQSPFTVQEDGTSEPTTEFVRVGIGNLGARVAAGAIAQFDYGIIDDDNTRSIDFPSGVPSSVSEGDQGAKTQTFTVTLPAGETGKSTVLYKVTGTATAGADYEIVSASDPSATSGEATIPAGSQTGTFDIDVLGDDIDESDETFTLTLIGATDATLEDSGSRSTTFTIEDDDPIPEVSLASTSFTGTEGESADVVVELASAAGQDFDVAIQDDGTGTAKDGGNDYRFPADPSVTIPAGETTGTISISLKSDGTVEPTETIDVSIDDGNTGPPLEDPTAATVSILDASGLGAQGPGGVGSASSVRAWLRADEGVTTSSGNVSTWADQSGNGNDATDDGSPPTFNNSDGNFNGLPVVNFGGSQYLNTTNLTGLPGGAHTLFAVSNAGGAGAVLGIDDGGFNSVRSLEYTDASTADASQDGTSAGGATNNATGTSVLYSAFGGGNVSIAANGGTGSSAGANTNANGTYAYLGGEVQNTGQGQSVEPGLENGLTGDVAEFIVYSTSLNTAQRRIVENYLAAKYGVGTISNDLYAGDLGADGTDGTADDRDTDVIGVGQAGDGTKHFSAQGAGFALSVAGGVDNGDFVLAGRKVGVQERINTTDTSTAGNIGVTARINEDRYLDITGNGISVDVTFNFADSDIRGPGGDPANYVLLRRGGTSGDWSKVSGNASTSGDKVTFAGVSLTDSQDGYFTIGTTDHDDSPLDTRYITVRGDAGSGNDRAYYHFAAPADDGAGTFGDIKKPNGANAIDFTADHGNTAIGASYMSYTWDGATQSWSAVTGSSTTLPTGKGFTMYLDDSNPSGTNDYRIDPEYTFGLQGVAFETDNVTVSVPKCTAGGTTCSDHGVYYMLGNPYLDAFDLSALNLDVDQDGNGNPDFQQAVDVWDSRQSSYIVKTRGTSGDKISRWQGFFIQRNDIGLGTEQLTFDNTGRVSSLVPFVGSKSKTSTGGEDDWARVALQLTARHGDKAVATDKAAVLLFHESAEAAWDAYDLTKRGAHGPTLALLGEGRDGTEIAKSQESRPFVTQDSFRVDLQLNSGHTTGTFEIRPHQWENIPSNWTLTLIDTKGTSSTDDDEQVVLGASETYQFEVASKSTEKASKTAETRSSLPTVKGMEKSSETPRFQMEVKRAPVASDGPSSDASVADILRFEAEGTETNSAQGNGRAVKLEWGVASESEIQGFGVQHKTKDGTFKSVGDFVKSQGTAKTGGQSDTTRYSTTVGVGYGTHTFRLKQVRANGTTHYSEKKTVELNLDGAYTLSAPYPNPFRSETSVELTVQERQEVQVVLYDALGRKVRRVYAERVPGNDTQTIRVRGDRLGSGMYFLRVKGENFSEVRKVVRLK